LSASQAEHASAPNSQAAAAAGAVAALVDRV
jgi:hypothetical protein